jgi:hypothetical protein
MSHTDCGGVGEREGGILILGEGVMTGRRVYEEPRNLHSSSDITN